jgi:methionine biosynthesis protein MetW
MKDETMHEQKAPETADLRPDQQIVADLVPLSSRVLDVGCGDGLLLHHLEYFKNADARGIELSMEGVRAAVQRGVSVIQGNADEDLHDYPDYAFDVVILSQTLQAMQRPDAVLKNLTRIGRKAIVSIPNFAYWRNRLYLGLKGRMPVNERLPYEWWNTPNIHFCTIRDLGVLCQQLGLVVENGLVLNGNSQLARGGVQGRWANLLGAQAIFVISRA